MSVYCMCSYFSDYNHNKVHYMKVFRIKCSSPSISVIYVIFFLCSHFEISVVYVHSVLPLFHAKINHMQQKKNSSGIEQENMPDLESVC